jgi:hypothetical protein
MSLNSLYFLLLKELIIESFKVKRKTKREPSFKAAAELNFESSLKPKEYDPFNYIPRLGNPLLSLLISSLSSSTSAPRYKRRAPLLYIMTVFKEAITTAAKDIKKKKLKLNTGFKLLSL